MHPETDSKNLEPILLVEDEPDHAHLTIKSFREHGRLMNPIIWLKSGEELIQYINNAPPRPTPDAPTPCLILLDLKLPMKNGFQVLEILKSRPQYHDVPVLMITSAALTEDMERAIRLGAADFIVKPIRFADFVDKMGHLGYHWAMFRHTHAETTGATHEPHWRHPSKTPPHHDS